MSLERAQKYHHTQSISCIASTTFIVFLLLTACGRGEIEPTPTPTRQALNETALTFETIEQNDFAGTGKYYEDIEPGLMIISGNPDIASLDKWITVEAIIKLKELDYENSFALIVFQGWKDSGGYNVQIERIVQAGKTVNIYAQFDEPKPEEERTLIVTSPYHLIKIQKSGEWDQEFLFQVIVGDTTVVSMNYFVP
jgi:hypothetical protein